jgi:phage FluMu gp28-like protein
MKKLTDILLPWQFRLFKAFQTNNRLITLCSRQIGKSFSAAFNCVYDCVVNGATWSLVSTGQRAADELFKKCVLLTKYFEGMLRGTPFHFSYTYNASTIKFSNGAEIVSLPNNPDTLRGRSSSLLFDEFAFIDNSSEVWQACIPFLTSPFGAEKKLQIISTPAGQSGKFYELWTKSDYFKTKVTLLDAVNEGFNVDVDEIRKTVIDEDIFASEYLCEFLDNDVSLFSYDLLRGSVYETCPMTGKVWIGIDIGRTHDKTSIAILIEKDGILYVKAVESLANKDFDYQEKYIANLIKSLNPVRVYIDATGIGAMLAENIHKKFSQASEIKFNNGNKQEMFNLTKVGLSNGTLKLPNDTFLIDDLHKIRRIVSTSGALTYSAKSDETGHADDATAVALGVYAARKRKATTFLPISI